MDTLVVAASFHRTTGMFVNDDYFPTRDDVVAVAFEELLSLNSIVQEADQRRMRSFVEIINTEHILNRFNARFGYPNGALLLVYLVVPTAL